MALLRVCRVINSMWTGGVQVRLLALLPLLKERGCEPHVLALRSRGELAHKLEEMGIGFTLLRVEGRIDPISIWRVRRFFAQHKFHVVHTHMYQANATGTIGAHLAGVPCVMSQAHNVDMYYKRRQVVTDRLLMGWRDGYLAVSDAVRQNTAQHLRLPADRLRVLYNGIDTKPDPRVKDRAQVLDELRLPADTVLIVHVARLHEQKNQRGFLQEFPRIAHVVPNARLLVVGDGKDRAELEHQVRQLGVHRSVYFLGPRQDVPDLLNAADISILPSRKEGFSNVILESMVYQAAIVATDVGGAREQIRDGVDGYLVPAGDMTAFRELVIKLAVNPSQRRKFVESAKRRVEKFSIERMANRTLQLYRDVLLPLKAWPEGIPVEKADEETE